MSIICENCGYTNPDGSKNCSNCYKPITEKKEKTKNRYRFEWPEKCSNCGAKVVPPSEKCEVCGERINVKKYRKSSFIPYLNFKFIAKIIAVIGILFLIFNFIYSPSKERIDQKTTVSNTMAYHDYLKIENGALKLDISDMADVTNFMNRTYDSFSRSPGDKNVRLFVYNYSDGSKLIIAMKPIGINEGLVLDYYNHE